MRYDADRKGRTRAAVLKAAARALRRDGPRAVSVASLMAEAGLTHGGFYAHFPSKDALVAEALGESFADAAATYAPPTGDLPAAEALRGFIRFYLSRRHRDAPESGCPLPALAAEVARMDGAPRERYGVGVEQLNLRVERLLEGVGRRDAQALASSVVAEMVGALSIARAMPRGPGSDRVLRRSRAALIARCGVEEPA